MAARDPSELAGALLVVGFDGTTLPPSLARDLAEKRRAGVILFKRNVASVEAVHALCRQIFELGVDPSPIVSVDQEGGRVARLGAPVLALPPMRELGDIGDPTLARRVGVALGRELAALGFNLDFAPVLDVDSNPLNPVIGDRSFSRDPEVVAALGAAFAEGLESAGVAACGKHFPGHGDTDKDSHLDLPFVAHDRARLDGTELLPFRRAGHAVATLMTAHVVFDALDPGVPATCSRKIVTELLRGELGYRGVVFSDDLEMRALAANLPVEESAVKAVRAGCDLVLVCKETALAERAYAALARECERDPAFRLRAEEAVERSFALRQRFPLSPAKDWASVVRVLESPEAARLVAEIVVAPSSVRGVRAP
ncbi:MAG TPA: beta-N-acetylhexosaminidase [Polyangiaceae bacterium]|nr:beta-N-acetylhexosaminidase [Polyangiaceae bacterium]